MSNEIILANGKRIATQEITETNDVTNVLKHYQRVIVEQSGAVASQLARYLTTAAASIEMAIDHSSTQGVFRVQPAASEVFRVSGLKLVMVSVTDPVVGGFGDIAALATGITLKHLDDTGDILDLLGGQVITTNEDIAAVADIELPASTVFVARFRFPGIVRVEGTDDTERLAMTFDDDLTGLTQLRVFAEGFVETIRN